MSLNRQLLGRVARVEYAAGSWRRDAASRSLDLVDLLAIALLCSAIAISAHAGAANAQPCQDPIASAPVHWVPPDVESGRRVLRVGPGRDLKQPSDAARAARDGDIVEIDSADYTDTAVWRQNRLWILGVGGRPHIRAPGKLAQDKAVWVIVGSEVTVENVEMSGARVPDRNGAGIRAQGRGLTVRASCFHDNENGILTSNNPANWLVVEFSEFASNGAGDGRSHNLYVGRVSRFEMRNSFSHGARVGHLVKSRAARNLIEYNRLVDDADGTASYELDLPSGGEALVRGNLISQSATSPNQGIISYAAEKGEHPPGRLQVLYNTVVSRRIKPIFVANLSSDPAIVAGNLFAGLSGTRVKGPAQTAGNRDEPSPEAFVNFAAGDLRPRSDCDRLAPSSPVDDPAFAALRPELQPITPLGSAPRRVNHRPMPAGAFDCPQ